MDPRQPESNLLCLEKRDILDSDPRKVREIKLSIKETVLIIIKPGWWWKTRLMMKNETAKRRWSSRHLWTEKYGRVPSLITHCTQLTMNRHLSALLQSRHHLNAQGPHHNWATLIAIVITRRFNSAILVLAPTDSFNLVLNSQLIDRLFHNCATIAMQR